MYRVLMLAMVLILFTGCGASGGGATVSSERFDSSNWSILQSDPNAHKGASVNIIGRVFIAPEKDEKQTVWQMYADPKQSEGNTIVYFADPSLVISDGDYVHVKGIVRGELTGTNAFGAEISAPMIDANEAVVVDALAAAPTAIHTATVGETQNQHGLEVTVDKVEFADSETRVFVTVKNTTGDEASFYDFNAKAVQGSKQYDAEYLTDGYPEIQSDILPGVETKGIVLFPAMDPAHTSKLLLESRTSDYSLDFELFEFTVAARSS